MPIAEAFLNLSQRLQIPALTSDNKGHYKMCFDNIEVTAFNLNSMLHLDGKIVTLENNQQQRATQLQECMKQLMVAPNSRNFLMYVDKEHLHLRGYSTIALNDLNGRVLEHGIERFVNTLEFLTPKQAQAAPFNTQELNAFIPAMVIQP